MKYESPNEWGKPCSSIFPAVASAQEDGHQRLHYEAESSGAGEARHHILKKLIGEQVRVARFYDPLNPCRRGGQKHRNGDCRQDCAAGERCYSKHTLSKRVMPSFADPMHNLSC